MDMAGLGLGDVVPNMSNVERLKDVHAIMRKSVGRLEPPLSACTIPHRRGEKSCQNDDFRPTNRHDRKRSRLAFKGFEPSADVRAGKRIRVKTRFQVTGRFGRTGHNRLAAIAAPWNRRTRNVDTAGLSIRPGPRIAMSRGTANLRQRKSSRTNRQTQLPRRRAIPRS